MLPERPIQTNRREPSALGRLENLTVARSINAVSNAIATNQSVSGVRGMVLWERNSDGGINYLETDHHTLSIYLGGGNRTWSCEHRKWGFAEAICVLPMGYDSHWEHNGYVKNLHLYFTVEDLEAMTWLKQASPEPLIYGRNHTLRGIASLLSNNLDWDDTSNQLTLDHLVLAMFTQLAVAGADKFATNQLPSSTINTIEERLHSMEDGPVSLASLADLVGLSPRHLTRQYKNTTGKTLSERQREIQIETAKNLLSSHQSLHSVAHRCGFSSQSHFSRVFRARTGATPTSWKKMSSQTS